MDNFGVFKLEISNEQRQRTERTRNVVFSSRGLSKMENFCEAAKSVSILAKINIVIRQEILDNRHFLKTVAQVI